MGRRTYTVPCPVCAHLDAEPHDFTVTVYHDPGCWRTANGGGWPESWEVDYDADQCPHFDALGDAEARIDAALSDAEADSPDTDPAAADRDE